MPPSYQPMNNSSSYRGTRSPEPEDRRIAGILRSEDNNANNKKNRGAQQSQHQYYNINNKEDYTMNASSYESQESALINYQLPMMNSQPSNLVVLQQDPSPSLRVPPVSPAAGGGAPAPANYSNNFSSSFMLSTNKASTSGMSNAPTAPGMNVPHHPDDAVANAGLNQPFSSHFSGQKCYNNILDPFLVFSGNYCNNQQQQHQQNRNSNMLGYPQLNPHQQQGQHFNQYHFLAQQHHQQQNKFGASGDNTTHSSTSTTSAPAYSSFNKNQQANDTDTNPRVLTRRNALDAPPISSTTSILAEREQQEQDPAATRPPPCETEERTRTESFVSSGSERSIGTTTNMIKQGEAKKKRTRKKKPKDSPRRPLSAYNFFFKDERKRILQAIPEKQPETSDEDDRIRNSITWPGKKKTPHGKIGFESLAKTIGARWKKLDKKSMKFYKALATKDLHRYAAEMQEYDATKQHLAGSKRTKVDEQQEEEEEEGTKRRSKVSSNLPKAKDKARSSTKQKQFGTVDDVDPGGDRSMAMDIQPAEAFNSCHQNIVGEEAFFSSNLDRAKFGSILSGINFGENENDDLFTFSKSEEAGDD